MDRTEELSEFLRSRRARLTPDEAGIGPGAGVRRVPGLRREEVARLAGINVDYYVRLERGRNLNASEAVLDAVARALRLDTTERAHLFALARPKPFRGGRPRPMPPQRVRPAMYRILEALEPRPAMIVGRRMDVLAANRTARALYTDFDALPHRERNFARFVFLDEDARSLFTDWRRHAADVVAGLHLYSGRHPCDPQLAELIGELSLRSAEFSTWWADHNVHQHTHGTKTFHHPVVGEMTLSYETLDVMGDRDQTLTVYTAEPATASEAALDLLASWSGQVAEGPAGPAVLSPRSPRTG